MRIERHPPRFMPLSLTCESEIEVEVLQIAVLSMKAAVMCNEKLLSERQREVLETMALWLAKEFEAQP